MYLATRPEAVLGGRKVLQVHVLQVNVRVAVQVVQAAKQFDQVMPSLL